MSLTAFQTALGRAVRARPNAPLVYDDLDLSPQERRNLSRVLGSAGFRATVKVQHSWCEARTVNGARLTLSILPLKRRRQLVKDWVEGGGGTNSFFAAEADSFLEFVAQRLTEPSHALSLCRLEQAMLRAEAIAAHFTPPDPRALDDSTRFLVTSRQAACVALHADFSQLLIAIEGDDVLPPLSDHAHSLLVAPGLPGFARPAGAAEVALWRSVTEPQTVAALLLKHDRSTIETLWAVGAVEVA
jgi:hypothetical protein